jgi:xanthine/uracil/vitamin C permease (AzgA family)
MINIPYYILHALVALTIQATVAIPFSIETGTAAGFCFYLGREVRDRQKLGAWDWAGLIFPTVAVFGVYFITLILQSR